MLENSLIVDAAWSSATRAAILADCRSASIVVVTVASVVATFGIQKATP